MRHVDNSKRPKLAYLLIILLLSYALFIGLYWFSHYKGMIVDGDATSLTLASEGIVEEGSITPPKHRYHGFGFPAILAFVSVISGESVQKIQIFDSIWLVVIVFFAFVVYRELTESVLLAMLGASILLLLPDFLFYVLRGSHEKITWLYFMLLLFLLSKSYRAYNKATYLTAFIVAFYLSYWGMVATNAYFASTMLTASFLSFGIGVGLLVMLWLRNRKVGRENFRDIIISEVGVSSKSMVRRFLLGSLISFLILFIFIFYLYPPARGFLYSLRSMVDKLGVLLLGGQAVSQPYAIIQTAWTSRRVYLSLVAPEFLFILASIITWFRYCWKWINGYWQQSPHSNQLLWLFYTAFIIQIGFAFILDFAGVLSSNLQLRIFPAFSILMAPYAAEFFYTLFDGMFRNRKIVFLISPLIFYMSIVGLLKMSNDPMVSNLWLFYSNQEVRGLEWMERYVENDVVWIDTWPHLRDVLWFRKGYNWVPHNYYIATTSNTDSNYVFISKLTKLQADRSQISLPSVVSKNMVYDSGRVKIYHKRPRSPYQR